jgi:hypothetical protein
MNKLLRSKHSAAEVEYDYSDEEVPAPPAFCQRITPEQMLELSRKHTEDQLRELDLFLRAHPEGNPHADFYI